MSKIIKITLNDKQLKSLEEIYEKSKNSLNNDVDSFDDFIIKTINGAIDTHLQFSAINEKVMSAFDSTMDSLGKNNFDLDNIDEFINNIFNKNNTNSKNKKDEKDESDHTSQQTRKIKN